MSKKRGRPYKWTPEQFEIAWQQYFQWVDDNPWMKAEAIKSGDLAGTIINVPTVRPYTEIGFCVFHDLGQRYLYELEETLSSKERPTKSERELSTILTRARAKCYNQKFEGATVGAFNANIIARDLGLVDKKDIDHKTDGESLNKQLSMDEAQERIKELMSGKS